MLVADIAHKFKVPKSVVHMHLKLMHLEEIIMYTYGVPKSIRQRTFFSINHEYSKIIVRLSVAANGKAHNNISKGIAKYDRPRRKKRKSEDYDDSME